MKAFVIAIPNTSKKKSKSIEVICDIFLKALYKNKQTKIPFLIDILNEKNIFYDKDVINKVSELIQEKELVEVHSGGIALFSYNQDGDFNDLSNVSGSVNNFRLSDKGKYLVRSGQKINQEALESKANKRRERLIGAGIVIITGLILMLAKYMFFSDQMK